MSQLYKWGEGGKQTSKTKSEGEILVYESFVFFNPYKLHEKNYKD